MNNVNNNQILLKFNKNRSILWKKNIYICLTYNDIELDYLPHILKLKGDEIFLKLDERTSIDNDTIYYRVLLNDKVFWVFSSDFEEIK